MTDNPPTSASTGQQDHISNSAARLTSAEEANALPIGSVIVMHHMDIEPVPHPGNTWFRIERGWINSYGSEVPAREDWPHIGLLGGPSAVTVAFRAEVADAIERGVLDP